MCAARYPFQAISCPPINYLVSKYPLADPMPGIDVCSICTYWPRPV